jgi:hypothetical protein
VLSLPARTRQSAIGIRPAPAPQTAGRCRESRGWTEQTPQPRVPAAPGPRRSRCRRLYVVSAPVFGYAGSSSWGEAAEPSKFVDEQGTHPSRTYRRRCTRASRANGRRRIPCLPSPRENRTPAADEDLRCMSNHLVKGVASTDRTWGAPNASPRAPPMCSSGTRGAVGPGAKRRRVSIGVRHQGRGGVVVG